MLLVVSRLLLSARVQAVVWVRLAHHGGRRAGLLGSLCKYVNHVVTGADVAHEARIGGGLVLHHPVGIVIGPDCTVGRDCTIMHAVTLGRGPGGSPTLGDHVYVGPGAVIIGAITVGNRARIGANAVVLKDVPAQTVAGGIPARMLGEDPPDLPPSMHGRPV